MLTHYSRVLKVFPTATCLNLKVLHFGNCFVERSPGMYSFSFGRNKLDSTLFLSLFCSVTLCMSLSSSGPHFLLCGISGLNYPYWVVLSISLLLIGLLLFSWFKV